MKVSYFETGRYTAPPDLPREWPVPPAAYDPETGSEAAVEPVRIALARAEYCACRAFVRTCPEHDPASLAIWRGTAAAIAGMRCAGLRLSVQAPSRSAHVGPASNRSHRSAAQPPRPGTTGPAAWTPSY